MLSLVPDVHPPSPVALHVRVRVPASPAPEPDPGEERLCATATCRNVVRDTWEETGRFCARCAIEQDLYDRDARRERAFPEPS